MNNITPERLREFTAILQKYKAGKASLERRVISAENWWKLRNRFEEAKQGLGDDGGFRAVSGWLHNVIVSKHADAMEAFPEPLILPRESSDRREAELLSAIIPCVLEQNRFEKTYDHAMWQKLKTGTAVYRVIWDSKLHGGLGDIAIERVDLLNLFWEPGVSDIQKSPYFFCTHLADAEELEREYPELRGRLNSSPFMASRFVYDDAVSTEGKVTLIEVYYKKAGLLHYCRYVGDTVLFATENGDGYECKSDTGVLPAQANVGNGLRAVAGDEQKGKAERHIGRSLQGPRDAAPGVPCGRNEESENGRGRTKPIYAHGRYPFIFDTLFPVEGSPCGYGYVDLCHNSQTAIDLMRSAFVKNTMVGATPRYFQRVDGSVNEEEFTDLSKAIVHVTGNLGEDSLRQIGFSGLPGAYLNVLESTIRELRETSGNTETATGTMNTGVTAAAAIAALQEASTKGSRDSNRASYQAFSELVELCIELIREFYTLPRQFRIAGAMGGEDFVSYSNEALRPRPALYVGGEPMGLCLPVFDVKVSAQRRSAYSRLSQNELAMELYRLGLFEQGREAQALKCLEMMEFEGKEKLLRAVNASAQQNAQLMEMAKYRELALALTRKYRPEKLTELGGA